MNTRLNKTTNKANNHTKPAALVARVEVAGVLGDQLEHLQVTDLRQPRQRTPAQQHTPVMRHAPFHPPPRRPPP